MAMLTAIMAMFEMATGVTNQQIMSRPPEDPYYASGAQAIDQAALDYLVKKLEVESVKTLPELCGKAHDFVKNNRTLADYSFAPIVRPDGRLLESCEASPRFISGFGEHHMAIAPLMRLEGGRLFPVEEPRFKRLSLWSCVVRLSGESCQHGSS